ncbi:MAG: hypothetical protein Ct9H90mP22_5090 [Gammaproteobacteria bacterium]|nr:MAG: hypothetical protein Ct9H90mP22_5090 [Gammaproteobacteria bacterium]
MSILGAKDQYGDACEVCGKTYDALDLKNPYSTLSNSEPVIKKSKHYFFKLKILKNFLMKQSLKTQIRILSKKSLKNGLIQV